MGSGKSKGVAPISLTMIDIAKAGEYNQTMPKRAAAFQMTYRHYQVLQILRADPSLPLRAIHEVLGMDKCYISRLISDLVQEQYITPPRRVLTAKGRGALDKPPPRLGAPRLPAVLK